MPSRFAVIATALALSLALAARARPQAVALGQQRYEDGRALLKRVPPSDPYYKTAQERLKMLEPSK